MEHIVGQGGQRRAERLAKSISLSGIALDGYVRVFRIDDENGEPVETCCGAFNRGEYSEQG